MKGFVLFLRNLVACLVMCSAISLVVVVLSGAAGTIYFELPDNGAISFGTDDDYDLLYDVTNNRLEFRDHDGNVLAHLKDDGTTGDFTVTGDFVPGTLNVESLDTAGAAGTAPISNGSSVLTMTDILTEAELDSEAELETQIGTGVYTTGDGALDDDDLSDNKVEDIGDVVTGARADGYALVWNAATSKHIYANAVSATTESALETQLTDVTNVWTNNDGTPLWITSIDTEAEFETLLTDVTDVYTDTDGALDDDDLSDNDLADLGDVDDAALTDNYVPHWDAANSKWIMAPDATATADALLADDETLSFGDSAEFKMLYRSAVDRWELTDAGGNVALSIQDLGTEFTIRANGTGGPQIMTEDSYLEDMSTAAATNYGFVSNGSGDVVATRILRSADLDTEAELEYWLADVANVYTDNDARVADVAVITPTDNAVLIGNGTHIVAESGSTLLTSIGAQPADEELSDIAALSPTDDYIIIGDGNKFTAELKTAIFAGIYLESVDKSDIGSGGTLSFDWVDSEVDNTLTISAAPMLGMAENEITATSNPIDVTGKSLIVLDPTGNYNIDRMTGGVDGQIVELINIDPTYVVTLKEAETEGGFDLPGDADYDLDPDEPGATFRYIGTDDLNHWRMIGGGASGGASAFTASADSGTGNSIENLDTLKIAGGTGISTSVATVDTVTTITVTNTASGASFKDYIQLMAASWTPETTSGCEYAVVDEHTLNTEKNNVYRLAFDKDSDEYAFVNVTLPADYASGLKGQVAWTSSNGTASTSTVNWEIQVLDFDPNVGDLTASAEEEGWTDGEVDTYLGVYYVHQTAWLTLDDNDDLEAGDYLTIRIRRDVSDDDLGYDALFLGLVLEYVKTSY